MNKLHNALAVIAAAAVAGCQAKAPPASADGGSAVSGVVRKAEVGVNCWQLIGDDSTHYELQVGQAPDSILVDGKQVKVNVKPRSDLMSTCQVGQIVDVLP